MLLSDLLKESLDTATLECWQRERTATWRDATRLVRISQARRSCGLVEIQRISRHQKPLVSGDAR